MKLTNALTPYPVLASFNEDYVGSRFDTEINTSVSEQNLQIEASFVLVEENLERLIDEGLAFFALHIECAYTRFRKLISFNTVSGKYAVPLQELAREVELTTLVVLNRSLDDFHSMNFHPDYHESVFSIPRGSILAKGKTIVASIDNSGSDSQSIFRVQNTNSSESEVIKVFTDYDEFISVGLDTELYDLYFSLGNSDNKDLILSTIFLPVLQEVIIRMVQKDNQDEIDTETHWYKVIEEHMKTKGINIGEVSAHEAEKSPLAIAQMLIELPVHRALKSISSTDGWEDNDF